VVTTKFILANYMFSDLSFLFLLLDNRFREMSNETINFLVVDCGWRSAWKASAFPAQAKRVNHFLWYGIE